MSYENAPATELLATSCAVCARPLLDAVSVESGMGPTCRKKHGYGEILAADDDTRVAANQIVHLIALAQSGKADFGDASFATFVARGVVALEALGFTKLASVIADRTIAIRIEDRGSSLAVHTPFSAASVEAFRLIPGRFWNRKERINHIPKTLAAREALHELLKVYFRGQTAIGPRGVFHL